jgi:hypothetical protein
MTATIVRLATRYPKKDRAIFPGSPDRKPGSFLMNPKFEARPPAAATLPVGCHTVPSHLQAPSGDMVVNHFWPFQNHRPSGET